MPIKAVAADIDGTLTDREYRVSCVAIDAVRRLESNGIPVLLASGNALLVVKTLQRYIGCTGAIICENGAVIEYRGELRIIGDRTKGEIALKALRELFGDRIIESWSNPYRHVDLALIRTIERKDVEDVIAKIPGVKFLDSGFAYHFVDERVNKGEGLRIASKLMGIDLSEIVAIGDGENDIDLLKVAGLKVALANSPEALRKQADYVTSKPDGDGLAETIELILSGQLSP